MNQNQEDERTAEKLEAAICRTAGPKTMNRNRPYDGQTHTGLGIRGSEQITGISLRDLHDCMIRGYILSHSSYKAGTLENIEPNATLIREALKGPFAQLNANDMFNMSGDVDPLAVIQNTACEVEKIMGIYPNIKHLDTKIGSKRITINDRLIQTGPQSYIADSGRTIVREGEVTHPVTGAKLVNFWVLRKNGVFQDADAYLHDLFERNNLDFEYPDGVTS